MVVLTTQNVLENNGRGTLDLGKNLGIGTPILEKINMPRSKVKVLEVIVHA